MPSIFFIPGRGAQGSPVIPLTRRSLRNHLMVPLRDSQENCPPPCKLHHFMYLTSALCKNDLPTITVMSFRNFAPLEDHCPLNLAAFPHIDPPVPPQSFLDFLIRHETPTPNPRIFHFYVHSRFQVSIQGSDPLSSPSSTWA